MIFEGLVAVTLGRDAMYWFLCGLLNDVVSIQTI
jgi:hypothetical protein